MTRPESGAPVVANERYISPNLPGTNCRLWKVESGGKAQ
jgi:hypothetical protein